MLSFSREGRPVPNAHVIIYLEMRSFEITADEAGAIVVLGDPRPGILSIEGDWDLDVRRMSV